MKPRPGPAGAPPRRRAPGVSPVAAGLLLGLVLPPMSAAWALCPNCLAQQSTVTPTLKLLALFLLVPFALAGTVLWVVRRLAYRRASPGAPPSPPASASPSTAPASSGGGVQGG